MDNNHCESLREGVLDVQVVYRPSCSSLDTVKFTATPLERDNLIMLLYILEDYFTRLTCKVATIRKCINLYIRILQVSSELAKLLTCFSIRRGYLF